MKTHTTPPEAVGTKKGGSIMLNMMNYVKQYVNDEEGQGMVEYGLIIALVAVVVIGVLTLMGTDLITIFTDITNAL